MEGRAGIILAMLERSGAEERLREGMRAALPSLAIEEIRDIVNQEIEDHLDQEEEDRGS